MSSEEIGFSIDGHIATVELRRPPNNFLDVVLIGHLANALEALDIPGGHGKVMVDSFNLLKERGIDCRKKCPGEIDIAGDTDPDEDQGQYRQIVEGQFES